MLNSPSISSNPVDALSRKLAALGQKAATELSKKLAELPRSAAEIMISRLNQSMNNLENNVEELYQTILQQCKEIVKGPKIRIEIPTHMLKLNSQNKWIKGKAIFYQPCSLTKLEVDCVVACDQWHKLGEIKEQTINIMDHLDKLLPPKQNNTFNQEGPIGLVTFQNGIRNDFENKNNDDFLNTSNLIIKQFPENPLCIGLYNPTTGNLFKDMHRFQNEPKCNKLAVYSLCQMIKTIADLMPQINPNLCWAHFAHSEAGLIANAVFELCEQFWLRETREYLKKHLITATYGAVKPIPNEYVLYARNTYSKNDIALFFGKHYIDKKLNQITEIGESGYESKKLYGGKNYHIRIVNSSTEKNSFIYVPERLSYEEKLQLSFFEHLGHQEMSLPYSYDLAGHQINDVSYQIKDHGFVEATYQKAFETDVANFRKNYKIFNHAIGK
ncbi:MAG: hypothetical protein H0V82_05340 [Candidatus Protochlamydia sp.]|nr:hypothetical protein [Candidatus Protochlamydia sp.]